MGEVLSASFDEGDVIQPDRGRVAMVCLIVAESAIFSIFVCAYLFYLGKSTSGPTPKEVLEVPIFNTVCLLASSWTIHLAVSQLERGRKGIFGAWWFATFVLGAVFLFGTGREWHRLIFEHGLTIRTNLFGTTYYSLVGLHALHVTVGVLILGIVLVFSLGRKVQPQHARQTGIFSLYWHFVDAVWVVVFTVVYIIGR